MIDAQQQFVDALARRGIVPPDSLQADGALHRCDAEGGRGKGDASYILHLNGVPAGGFQNWRDGLGWETWTAKLDRALAPAEALAQWELIAEAKRKAASDAEQRRVQAKEKAAGIWARSENAPGNHSYLRAKGIKSHGLRIFNGALVVPVRDGSELHSLQFIDADSSKRFLAGGQVRGHYFSIGTASDVVAIVEGYATGASVFECVGCAVAVAFDCGNLEPVARAMRAKFPAARIVVCADDDHKTDGNPGLTKAAEAAGAVGGLLAVPNFGDDRPGNATDMNDLHRLRGSNAVEGAIREARAPDVSTPQPSGNNATAADLRPHIWAEPAPIRAALHPVPAFDPEALLPDVLRAWVMDESERMPCTPDFVAATAIVALGAVIGARCAIKPKARDSWLVVPNFWGGIVAPPSAKKSPAIAAGMAMIDQLAAKAQEAHRTALEAFETDKVVSEARRDAIKDAIKSEAKRDGGNIEAKAQELNRHKAEAPQPPVMRRYRTNDTTTEKLGELLRDNPAGLLVMRDELVGLLASWDKEGREGDRSFFLEAWNGTGGFDTDRIGRGSILIPNLCVSIFGGIQPDKLTEYLEQAAHALGNDGTLQRFQVLVYPDARPWEWRDRIPNKLAREAARSLFGALAELDPVAYGATPADESTRFPHFRFSEEAQQVFIEWMHELQRDRIPREQTDGHPLIAQHLAKYEKLFAALALTFHLVDCAATSKRGPVSESAAIRAAAWCEYLEAHARRCYGLLADEGFRAAEALSTRIQRGALSNGFTLRDVRRNRWRYLTTDRAIQAALDWLEDDGWLIAEEVGGAGPGTGRRTHRYAINPIILKSAGQGTAKAANRVLTAVTAVPQVAVSGNLGAAND